MQITVVGGNGFVGKHLVQNLANNKNYSVTVWSRSPSDSLDKKEYNEVLIDIGQCNNLVDHLVEQDVVIYLASQSHKKNIFIKRKNNKLAEEDFHNCKNFFEACKSTKVKRFIFLSSIGIYGFSSDQVINEKSIENPKNLYSKTKLRIEKMLLNSAANSSIELVIVRAPAVYGNGAGGFIRLLNLLIRLKIPLPVKSINNRRSFIDIKKLINFLEICMVRRSARNQLFNISDTQALSTLELVEMLAKQADKYIFVFSFPPLLLRKILRVLMLGRLGSSLTEDLKVDCSKAEFLIKNGCRNFDFGDQKK